MPGHEQRVARCECSDQPGARSFASGSQGINARTIWPVRTE
jgi:hypothetical protein